jgi:hypothetical protein
VPAAAAVSAATCRDGFKNGTQSGVDCVGSVRPGLASLKQAGLDLVMIHVDEGQQRGDLGVDPTPDEVNDLRVRLTLRAARHGLDTGLCVTLYRDNLASLSGLVRLIVASEHIHFLFATNFADIHGMMRNPDVACESRRTTNPDVIDLLRASFGLEPFASVGGHGWVSYFVPVLYGGRKPRVLRLRAGAADALLMKLPRMLSGRHMFYCPSRPLGVGTQVAVNQLARGEVRGCLDWLGGVFRGRERLDAKRMVFDNGPVVGPHGCVLHLESDDRTRSPLMSQVAITDHCNYECPVCYADSGPREDPTYLPVDEVLRRIRAG